LNCMSSTHVSSTDSLIITSPSHVDDDVQSQCDFLVGLSCDLEFVELLECIEAFSVSPIALFGVCFLTVNNIIGRL
jgi:hypothetical protein